jgi:iron(III) transport system permease protein|tara:strand:+ start:5418 stop:7073 length:1656 start_codon:yes stop_codon:yes gene_type:complete
MEANLSKKINFRYRLNCDRWVIFSIIIAALVLLPIAAIIWMAFFPAENIWPHLIATSLSRYLSNSLIIMISVAFISSIVGTGCAWMVVTKDFPLRRILEWVLLFPLAIPAYIGAYSFVDFWEYAGPVQTFLRDFFDWQSSKDYYFPQVRSIGAAIFVISMSLYPYVYLLARAAFRDQSSRTFEVSRALGAGPWRAFWLVSLPLARPAIAIGIALVMMEALNDFGAVEFFAVQTLTTGIFTVWLEASNVGGAAQIAMVIFIIVISLVVFERFSRRKMRVHQRDNQSMLPIRDVLPFWKGILIAILCSLPVLFGFIMPFLIMLDHAFNVDNLWTSPTFLRATWTSIWVGFLAAIFTVGAALILIFGIRSSQSTLPRIIAPIATIGYAAPGAVLALGILLPMAYFDRSLADFIENFSGINIGLLLTGSATAVIFAYSVRFFALAFGSIDSAMGRFSPNIGHAARSLGLNPSQTLSRVHVPMIWSSMLIALLLVFVDSIKELPATLLLRPFGFETLSTQIYNAASLEDIEGASGASIIVILVGMIAVAIIARASR